MTGLGLRLTIWSIAVITNHAALEEGRPVVWPEALRPTVERAVLYRPTEAWTYSHHPHLTWFGGRWYAMWSNGHQDEDAPGQRVLMATSEDFLNWTPPMELMAPGRMGDGVERVLTAGGWHSFEGQLVAYAGDYGPNKETTRLVARTTRNGATWGELLDLGIPVCPNHGPQRLRSGRLVMTGNLSLPWTDDPAGLTGWRMAGLYPPDQQYPKDDPATFSELSRRQGWPNGLCEGSIFETDDSHLHVLLRAVGEPRSDWLWHAVSTDQGLTWSTPTRTEFSNTNAKFHVGRLPGGLYYWVGNPAGSGRSPLVMSISQDGFDYDRHVILGDEPWPMARPGRWKGGEYGYPHTVVRDGYLHVICSRQKEGVEVLRVALADVVEPPGSRPHWPVNYAPDERYDAEARRFQGIPGLERAPGGRLWAVWYAGRVTEDRYNYVVAVTSGDNGDTWSDLKLVIDPDGAGPLRAFDPCPWLDPDGRLWLFYSVGGAGEPRLLAITCDNPDSAEPAWSEPRDLGPGIMMCKPIVADDGAWLLPTALWHREGSCRVMASTDRGATWELRGVATVPDPADRDCDEPMLVQRRDGSLWQLVRTKYGIGETTSTDGGRNWTAVTPSTICHTTSRFFIRRLASGRLLLVKHGAIDVRAGRSHLTAYLSDDDGATWQGGLLLDERNSVSYPDGTQAPDGLISVIYDWQRVDDKHILAAQFTEADILAGELTSPASRLRVLVNAATGVNPKPWVHDGRKLRLQPNRDGVPFRDGPRAVVVPTAGEARTIELGGRIFDNRAYLFAMTLPTALRGRQYLFSNLETTRFTCQTAGLVYVLTPQPSRNRDSVSQALLAAGFEKVAMPEFLLFRGHDGAASGSNVCTVYQKEMEAGEELALGKWCVVVW